MLAFSKRRGILFGGAVVWLLLLCAATSFAQSLGDVARQQRERKKDQQAHETHVYTNDDLSQEHILVPEDQARALTAKSWNEQAPATEASASATESAPAIHIPPAPKATAVRSPVIPAMPSPPVPAKPLPPLPAVALVPAPALVRRAAEIPVAASSVASPNPHPQPRPVIRTASNEIPRTALVSSPTGWNVVYAEPRHSQPLLSSFPAPPQKPATQMTPARVPAKIVKVRPNVTAPGDEIRVERGDSLWKLARRYLGEGARWHELAKLNPELSNPNLLRVGDMIHLAQTQPPQNAKQVVVHSGDTLWSVARAEFGTSLAFSCIAGANPQLESADRIHPGQTLLLPQTCAIAR
jgi:nucleoid-associated protein YgaU